MGVAHMQFTKWQKFTNNEDLCGNALINISTFIPCPKKFGLLSLLGEKCAQMYSPSARVTGPVNWQYMYSSLDLNSFAVNWIVYLEYPCSQYTYAHLKTLHASVHSLTLMHHWVSVNRGWYRTVFSVPDMVLVFCLGLKKKIAWFRLPT